MIHQPRFSSSAFLMALFAALLFVFPGSAKHTDVVRFPVFPPCDGSVPPSHANDTRHVLELTLVRIPELALAIGQVSRDRRLTF